MNHGEWVAEPKLSLWEAVAAATDSTVAMGPHFWAMLLTIAVLWAAAVVYVGFMLAPSKSRANPSPSEAEK